LQGADQTIVAAAFAKAVSADVLDSAFGEPGNQALASLFGQNKALKGGVPYEVNDPSECIRVGDAIGFAAAYRTLGARIAERHMQKGVFLLDPDRTIIEADVQIGAGTLVYPDNTLQGQTVIAEGCTLYPGNRMQNASIGQGTTVESSVLLDCAVGSHTTVGPFAYLRPHTQIGDHCRIGDFVEVKNSSIDDGTKVSHLTYVGDSDLGKDINLGCGVVFVNYDGKTKNRCRVEDHAFIGCNCNLVAPVHIGKNAYLAAGSTITEDVPADALYVARSRGVVKEDWVNRRKSLGKL
jgi:bifunctional UDP-N-acetylglucosamine pyrophosphorylase/glucosamine-1-phosphate N-acetyltransferase